VAFACIFIPDFPAQAVVRQDPDLRDKPVVILAGAAPLTKVFATNRAARAVGVEVGMTKLQAEACGGYAWRWRSTSQETTAQAALLDCAWTISPRVEEGQRFNEGDQPGTVVLDIAGCEKLFGSDTKIAEDLRRVAVEVGLEANVSVAENPETAVCAARGFAGITIIPPGKEAQSLGVLPLTSLSLPAELLETLHRWGIHTCAEFAALPEIPVIERLGQEGQKWHRLCRGSDARPLMAKEFPEQFEECMELEFPLELLEPLMFLLNRLLNQLCVRLRMHVLGTSEVKVTLTLQPADLRNKETLQHIRTLRLPTPVTQSKVLLKLLQLDLQAHPPSAPVTAINMVVVPTRSRTRQLGLFLPLSPEPEALEITLARIQRTVGEGRVGAPVLLDSYAPDAFAQNRFVLPEASVKLSVGERPARSALRIYRPPLAATVDFEDRQPVSISCGNGRKPVLAFAGPIKTNGEWWSETAWAREEWDVLVPALHPKFQVDGQPKQQEKGLYRIYRDLQSKRWFVEGIYD
jgi:protein ImuB